MGLHRGDATTAIKVFYATALADVVRFLLGMAKVGVQNLDLKTQGEVMWLSLSIPEAELEKAAQRAAALRR